MEKLLSLRKRAPSALAVALVLAMAGMQSAQAAAIDVDDVVADIVLQHGPINLIGGAVLLVFVAIKAFKWVRRALS